MMKIDRRFQAPVIFLILVFAQTVSAQWIDERERPRYRMELVWIEDGESDKREYVFVIGPLGFKTVEGLKRFIGRLPAGSILEWSPGCVRRGNEPLLSSAEELEDFHRFCAEHGVEFLLHPSG
jgi:hypothetical protein